MGCFVLLWLGIVRWPHPCGLLLSLSYALAMPSLWVFLFHPQNLWFPSSNFTSCFTLVTCTLCLFNQSCYAFFIVLDEQWPRFFPIPSLLHLPGIPLFAFSSFLSILFTHSPSTFHLFCTFFSSLFVLLLSLSYSFFTTLLLFLTLLHHPSLSSSLLISLHFSFFHSFFCVISLPFSFNPSLIFLFLNTLPCHFYFYFLASFFSLVSSSFFGRLLHWRVAVWCMVSAIDVCEGDCGRTRIYALSPFDMLVGSSLAHDEGMVKLLLPWLWQIVVGFDSHVCREEVRFLVIRVVLHMLASQWRSCHWKLLLLGTAAYDSLMTSSYHRQPPLRPPPLPPSVSHHPHKVSLPRGLDQWCLNSAYCYCSSPLQSLWSPSFLNNKGSSLLFFAGVLEAFTLCFTLPWTVRLLPWPSHSHKHKEFPLSSPMSLSSNAKTMRLWLLSNVLRGFLLAFSSLWRPRPSRFLPCLNAMGDRLLLLPLFKPQGRESLALMLTKWTTQLMDGTSHQDVKHSHSKKIRKTRISAHNLGLWSSRLLPAAPMLSTILKVAFVVQITYTHVQKL